jgi:hypothetical protein
MPNEPKPDTATHAQRFDALLTGLFSVSKAEILRREAEYKKQRKARKDGGGKTC